MNILFIRRKGYSVSSLALLSDKIRELGDHTVRTWHTGQKLNRDIHRDLYVRWGFEGMLPFTPSVPRFLNSKFIRSDKGHYARIAYSLNGGGFTIEGIYTDVSDATLDRMAERCEHMVVRPRRHVGGQHFYKVSPTRDGLRSAIEQGGPLFARNGWYARPFFNKTREFRVFVLRGKVINVYEKFPENPEADVWNHDAGGTVRNLRFSQWPLDVIHTAVRLSDRMKQELCAVDMMADNDGNHQFLEFNRTPNLEGDYRASCIAKAIVHYAGCAETGDFTSLGFNPVKPDSFKSIIHPAIWSPVDVDQV